MSTAKMIDGIRKNFFDVIEERKVSLNDFMNQLVRNRRLDGKTEYQIEIRSEITEGLSEETEHAAFYKYIGTAFDMESNFYLASYRLKLDELDSINQMYLNCAEEVYREWISDEFRRMKDRDFQADFGNRIREEQPLEELKRKADYLFREKLKQVFEIDLNIINEIAGTYYESKSSEAVMCFSFAEQSDGIVYQLALDENIEFKREDVILNRKMLQMVQPGQCLLYERCHGGSGWKIRGIAKQKEVWDKGITFRMKGHMFWEMEWSGVLVVCYKCGEYVIEQDWRKIEEFKECYKRIFHKEPVETVIKIVSKAIELKHGSALIFLKEKDMNKKTIDTGVCRYEVAAGFKTAQRVPLEPEQLENISAIDGTVLLDEEGKCLKFGMILNTAEQGGGDSKRGSRYNSVYNYIKNCKMQGISAVGLVVSEDKIVNILPEKS